jgi:hypothetical protein
VISITRDGDVKHGGAKRQRAVFVDTESRGNDSEVAGRMTYRGLNLPSKTGTTGTGASHDRHTSISSGRLVGVGPNGHGKGRLCTEYNSFHRSTGVWRRSRPVDA